VNHRALTLSEQAAESALLARRLSAIVRTVSAAGQSLPGVQPGLILRPLRKESIMILGRSVTLSLAVAMLSTGPIGARQPPPQATTPEQRVAALKQSMQQSQTRLHQYEWIETTIIKLKGEEKARKVMRCYYGADGKLTKVAMSDAAPKAQPQAERGGRGGGRLKGKIVESKKDDMKEYMERAAALVHKYVPPDPALIQKAKDAGNLKISPPDQGAIVVEVANYLQAGDKLALKVDAAANRLQGITVATYLDKPEDAVNLNVAMNALQDGTVYNAQTTLDATAKNIQVVIQNTGHRPMQR